MFRIFISLFLLHNVVNGVCQQPGQQECSPLDRFDGKKVHLTENEWKDRLTPEQFKVLRKGDTEPAFKNAYFNNTQRGIYLCAGCALPLFSSQDQYESKTGWPSFTQPICPENVSLHIEYKFFLLKRVEVKCSRCDGHLGHVFDDGPPPTGKRFCMNSAALQFVAR